MLSSVILINFALACLICEIGIKLEYFADKIWLIHSECVYLPTEQNSRISDIALTLSNESGLSTYHNADYRVVH